MGKHHRILTIVAVVLSMSCARQVQPENVILISIDTLRADHLGCYGHEAPTSPTLDGLAAEGLLFEDVSTPSPWTLPAHASMLTGLYPNRHALKSNYTALPQDVATMAEVLREQGFATGAIVNSHHLSRRYGLDRGFAEFHYVPEHVSEIEPSRVGAMAEEWLAKRDDGRFFLFLHYYDVHSDYRSLPRYEEMFVGPYAGEADGSTALLQSVRWGQATLTPDDVAHLIDLYDAGIRQMDDGIARLLRFLDSSGLADNTLVVVTSDHGEEFLEHGGVLHGRTHYQEIVQVPLIMRGPGLPRGRRIASPISLIDLMPTLLARVGVDVDPALDGIDLRPTWADPADTVPARALFFGADWKNAHHDVKRAVREDGYKLMVDRLSGSSELYNIVDDPEELNDLSRTEVQKVSRLFVRLEEYLEVNIEGLPLDEIPPEDLEKLRSLGYIQ